MRNWSWMAEQTEPVPVLVAHANVIAAADIDEVMLDQLELTLWHRQQVLADGTPCVCSTCQAYLAIRAILTDKFKEPPRTAKAAA